MEELKPGDGTVYAHGTLSQIGVGEIDLSTMLYLSSDGRTCALHNVEIRSWATGPVEGWGEKIFDGSLKEAIDIFRAGLEARKEATDGRD